jgi:hypothetical protein
MHDTFSRTPKGFDSNFGSCNGADETLSQKTHPGYGIAALAEPWAIGWNPAGVRSRPGQGRCFEFVQGLKLAQLEAA